MKLFDMDSPLMIGLNKMADLMILNLLTILCCLPVVTVGASLTAMHYMVIKLIRNEESYVVKGFFRSFKQNLRQGRKYKGRGRALNIKRRHLKGSKSEGDMI